MKPIKMFGMDVDGVLTDGGIYYGDGQLEIKRFHVQDGMGITLLRKAGIIPFVITARRSVATERRARELNIRETFQGVRDKLECLERLIRRYGFSSEEIAYIGDDLSDLEILKRVGLPLAVANAVEEVRNIAHYVTKRSGGNGAVREACEYVLNHNGIGRPFSVLLKNEHSKEVSNG